MNTDELSKPRKELLRISKEYQKKHARIREEYISRRDEILGLFYLRRRSILRRYKGGASIKEIAMQDGVSYSSIANVIASERNKIKRYDYRAE